MTDKTMTRFVCVGKAALAKGGIGSLVLPETALEPVDTQNDRSTIFKVTLTVGGLYEGDCAVDDDGNIRSIPKRPVMIAKADGDWTGAILEEERLTREKAMENFAKRAAADRFAFAECRNLAAMVRKVPYRHRMAACQTLASLIFDQSMKAR